MAQTIDMDAILKLSRAERLKLIEMIWQTLSDKADPLPDEVIAEMERRATRARANPEDGFTLEELKRRLKERRARPAGRAFSVQRH